MRLALRHKLESLKNEYPKDFEYIDINSTAIYLDVTNNREYGRIITIFEADRVKFKNIIIEILKGRYNYDLYDRENPTTKTKNITAMKFKGSLQNARVYCREDVDGKNKRLVIMVHGVEYKSFKKAGNKII